MEEDPLAFEVLLHQGALILLGDVSEMETTMASGSNFMLDIHRQLAARNAVEVHAFREITTDYQRCLSQLRELRVRTWLPAASQSFSHQLAETHALELNSEHYLDCAEGAQRTAGQGSSGAQARKL